MSAREVTVWVPRSVLKSLMDRKQGHFPFQTDELGFPLRIKIAMTEAAPRQRMLGRRASPEEEDKDPV